MGTTYPTEEDAARAVYKEAVRCSYGGMASWIINTHHVRNIPSYAWQRLAALDPEEVTKLTAGTNIGSCSALRKKCSLKRRNLSSQKKNKKKRSSRSKKKQSFTSPKNTTIFATSDTTKSVPAGQDEDAVPKTCHENSRAWGAQPASCRSPDRHCACTSSGEDITLANGACSSGARSQQTTRPMHLQPHVAGRGTSHAEMLCLATGSAFSSRRRVFEKISSDSERVAIQSNDFPSSFGRSALSSSDQRFTSETGFVSAHVKKSSIMNPSVNIPTDSTKFKLFNVEINVSEEMAHAGRGGHPQAQTSNEVGFQSHDCTTHSGDTQDLLHLPRKRTKITKSVDTNDPWESGLQTVTRSEYCSPFEAVAAISRRHEVTPLNCRPWLQPDTSLAPLRPQGRQSWTMLETSPLPPPSSPSTVTSVNALHRSGSLSLVQPAGSTHLVLRRVSEMSRRLKLPAHLRIVRLTSPAPMHHKSSRTDTGSRI